MGRQFTPDYVSTYLTPSGTVVTRNCFDSLDSGAVLNETPEECWAGDPPAMSPDFNVQYYNPEIRYFPAVDYDGTPRVSMTCQNTGGLMVGTTCLGGWTAVPVGVTCRLCDRKDCPQRAFPPLNTSLLVDENLRGMSFYAPPPVAA